MCSSGTLLIDTITLQFCLHSHSYLSAQISWRKSYVFKSVHQLPSGMKAFILLGNIFHNLDRIRFSL